MSAPRQQLASPIRFRGDSIRNLDLVVVTVKILKVTERPNRGFEYFLSFLSTLFPLFRQLCRIDHVPVDRHCEFPGIAASTTPTVHYFADFRIFIHVPPESSPPLIPLSFCGT
jgi:hypothetical protein